jgi:lambda repressor-like predicted transcriptional regulator
MTHADIEKALKERGYSWRSAAKVIGKSPTALIRVCKRDLDSVIIAKSISTLIDSDVKTVFQDKSEYHDSDTKTSREQLIEKGRQKLIDAGLVQVA